MYSARKSISSLSGWGWCCRDRYTAWIPNGSGSWSGNRRTSAPRANNATDRPTPLTDAERAEYDAIGESDRMTLRFRKPE